MLERPGPDFQARTRYRRDTMSDTDLDWHNKPATYKIYADVPVFELPPPKLNPDEGADSDLWTCVSRRRSVRAFGGSPVSLPELSHLLWASAGITNSYITPHGQEFYRAAPTAGALYPIETYVVANNVADLAPGLYHYRVAGQDARGRPSAEGSHALEQLRAGDMREELVSASLGQPFCGKAGVVFLWTAVFPRSIWKYRDRAYRYVYLDAGHIAAHVSLAAVACGLGSCQVAAFFDDEIDQFLDVDGESEGIVYMTAVGRPSRPPREK